MYTFGHQGEELRSWVTVVDIFFCILHQLDPNQPFSAMSLFPRLGRPGARRRAALCLAAWAARDGGSQQGWGGWRSTWWGGAEAGLGWVNGEIDVLIFWFRGVCAGFHLSLKTTLGVECPSRLRARRDVRLVGQATLGSTFGR